MKAIYKLTETNTKHIQKLRHRKNENIPNNTTANNTIANNIVDEMMMLIGGLYEMIMLIGVYMNVYVDTSF